MYIPLDPVIPHIGIFPGKKKHGFMQRFSYKYIQPVFGRSNKETGNNQISSIRGLNKFLYIGMKRYIPFKSSITENDLTT